MTRFYVFLKARPILEFSCIFKETGSRDTFSRQSVKKYFGTFLPFRVLSLYHKWTGTKLLSPKVECTSCFTSCRTNLRKRGNFRKTSNWMQASASAMSPLPKKKLATALKNWKTSLDGKSYFTRFCKFVRKFVPNIFWLVVDSRAIYMILGKKITFNLIINTQFNYYYLVWIFCSRTSNNKINKLYKKSLYYILLNDFKELFQNNKYSNINQISLNGNYAETVPMRKLCLSAKFPHQEIRWNHGIFRSVWSWNAHLTISSALAPFTWNS